MTAFVYKWTHLPTLNWYVGSSIGKRKSYLCSSKVVKDMIKLHPLEWERTVIATGMYDDMYNLESTILQTLDAKNDNRSFNKHNNDGVNSLLAHTPEARAKRSTKVKGVPRPQWVKDKIGLAQKGVPKSKEQIIKMSKARKGVPWTEARWQAQKKKEN